MNEQQRLIKDTLHRLLTDQCGPAIVDQAEAGQFPQKLWDTLTETGLTVAGIPEASGGSGGDLDDSLLVIREAARFAAPVPLSEHFMAGLILSDHGASIGTDPVTVAAGDFSIDEQLRLQGSAENVAFARWCHQIVLVARSSSGLRLCRVNCADVEIVENNNIAGEPRDSVVVDVTLVPEEVFETDDAVLNKIRLLGAVTRCMMMAGALDSVLEMSVQYSLERSQFGRPIAKFQAIQQQLAVLAGEVAASTMAGHAIASSFDQLDELDIAIGKARIGESVSSCTDIAHQVHGAMGYTLEHSLNHRTRRLWSWREEYGNEREWQIQVGKAFLEGGADKLWDTVTSRR